MIFSTTSRFAISSRSAGPFQSACQRKPRRMCVSRPVIRLSSVDMPRKSAMFWKVRAIPCRATACGRIRPRRSPRNRTSPFCGR